MKFHAPVGAGRRSAPAKTPGLRHLAFAVDDIDAVVASLRARGEELLCEVERYEDSYRLWVSEEAARAAPSALATIDTAERLLDRDLEASDDAGVAASRE